MAKKKNSDNEDLMSDFFKIEETEDEIIRVFSVEEPEINYDAVTYAHTWNKLTNSFDLLIVNINTDSNRTKIVREKTKFSSEYQIHAEMLKRINNDFMFKGRKK